MISNMVFWIVWLVMGVFFILLLATMIIPRIMLRTYAATLPVKVKALERAPDTYGDTVVYSSPSSVRKYIKSYRLGKDAHGVWFCGEWNEKAAYVEYEITAFGADGEIKEIFRVKEKFNGGSSTHITRLPDATDYVALRLVCIDDNPVSAERRSFNLNYALWLSALCVSFAAAVDLLLWLGITFALRCLDGFSMELELPMSTWIMLLGCSAAVIAAFTCFFSLGKFFMRRRGDKDE